jgi:hypothetical protein
LLALQAPTHCWRCKPPHIVGAASPHTLLALQARGQRGLWWGLLVTVVAGAAVLVPATAVVPITFLVATLMIARSCVLVLARAPFGAIPVRGCSPWPLGVATGRLSFLVGWSLGWLGDGDGLVDERQSGAQGSGNALLEPLGCRLGLLGEGRLVGVGGIASNLRQIAAQAALQLLLVVCSSSCSWYAPAPGARGIRGCRERGSPV